MADKGALTGRCHCGRITWESDGPVAWSCYCHCPDCRRNTASPVTAFFGVPHASHRWTGEPPAIYRSSPGVERLFCPDCGTPMAYRNAGDKRNIHLYVATLDDPESVQPSFHVFHAHRLAWFDTADGLPRHDRLRQ